MKIYDKTLLQNEAGEIGVTARLRGTLKYGFSWYPDLQAQKVVIAKLEKLLERGYVLIRNFTLPGSEVVIPIILIGPPGIQVITVSDVKGFFEAKGTEWNTNTKGRAQPASVNLLKRADRFSRAFQAYLKRQKIELPCTVEAVLVCANPGAHLETVQPAIRVVKSDAVNSFAESLLKAYPIMQTGYIHDLADHIINPRPPGETRLQAPLPLDAAQLASSVSSAPSEPSAPARARAIFGASQEAEPINPADLEFALREEARAGMESSTGSRQSGVMPMAGSAPLSRPGNRSSGLSARHVLLLAFMALVECAVLVAFGWLLYFNR